MQTLHQTWPNVKYDCLPRLLSVMALMICDVIWLLAITDWSAMKCDHLWPNLIIENCRWNVTKRSRYAFSNRLDDVRCNLMTFYIRMIRDETRSLMVKPHWKLSINCDQTWRNTITLLSVIALITIVTGFDEYVDWTLANAMVHDQAISIE